MAPLEVTLRGAFSFLPLGPQHLLPARRSGFQMRAHASNAVSRVLAAVLLAATLAFPSVAPALADGKVFSVGIAQPTIPDQEALIHWSGGVETLLIQTSFSRPPDSSHPAPDGALAWVVPIPGATERPEVFAVDSGVFPTLRSAFAPRVVGTTGSGTLLLLITMAAIGVALAMVSPRPSVVVRALFLTFCLIVLMLMLLPTLGKARSADSALGLSHLHRTVVGNYDVAVLASPDGSAITSWLNSNGFKVGSDVAPVFSDYAKDGWSFVAAKLRTIPGPHPSSVATHPLGFRFKAEHPIYPLRLTAHATDSLKLDLYVFGPSMARCDGMQVVRCDAPIFNRGLQSPRDRSYPGEWRPRGQLVIGHSELLRLLPNCPTATKLSGQLSRTQMQRDATITWAAPATIGATAFTREVAQQDAAVPLALAALLALAVMARAVGKGTPIRQRRPALVAIGLLGAAGSLVTLAVIPTVKVKHDGFSPAQFRGWHYSVANALCNQFKQGASLEEARAAAAVLIQAQFPSSIAPSIIQEVSPWNYELRISDDGQTIEYDWFDIYGQRVWGNTCDIPLRTRAPSDTPSADRVNP